MEWLESSLTFPLNGVDFAVLLDRNTTKTNQFDAMEEKHCRIMKNCLHDEKTEKLLCQSKYKHSALWTVPRDINFQLFVGSMIWKFDESISWCLGIHEIKNLHGLRENNNKKITKGYEYSCIDWVMSCWYLLPDEFKVSFLVTRDHQWENATWLLYPFKIESIPRTIRIRIDKLYEHKETQKKQRKWQETKLGKRN